MDGSACNFTNFDWFLCLDTIINKIFDFGSIPYHTNSIAFIAQGKTPQVAQSLRANSICRLFFDIYIFLSLWSNFVRCFILLCQNRFHITARLSSQIEKLYTYNEKGKSENVPPNDGNFLRVTFLKKLFVQKIMKTISSFLASCRWTHIFILFFIYYINSLGKKTKRTFSFALN